MSHLRVYYRFLHKLPPDHGQPAEIRQSSHLLPVSPFTATSWTPRKKRSTNGSHSRIYYQFHNSLPLPAGGDRGSRWGLRIYYHFLHSLPPAGLRSHHASTTHSSIHFHLSAHHTRRAGQCSHLLPNLQSTTTRFSKGASKFGQLRQLASTTTFCTHCHKPTRCRTTCPKASHLLPLFVLTATARDAPEMLDKIDSHLLPILRSTAISDFDDRLQFRFASHLLPNIQLTTTRGSIRAASASVRLAPTTKHSTHYHVAMIHERGEWPRLAPTTKHSTHYHRSLTVFSTRGDGARTYYQTFNSLPPQLLLRQRLARVPRTYYQTFNSLPPATADCRQRIASLAPTTKHSTHYHPVSATHCAATTADCFCERRLFFACFSSAFRRPLASHLRISR